MDNFKNYIDTMVCDESQPIPLAREVIEKALELEGEFGCILANYEDCAKEIEEQKLRYKVSEALSVVISFEDDGRLFEQIEQCVKYISGLIDPKQNFLFGVKQVEKLSEYPITVLFSGILPINQLHLHIGKEVEAFINSDEEYFPRRFAVLRQELSQEIGIPILPVVPVVDEKIGQFDVVLKDPVIKEKIAEFTMESPLTKERLDPYLYRLFTIYKVLAEEKCYNRVIKQ